MAFHVNTRFSRYRDLFLCRRRRTAEVLLLFSWVGLTACAKERTPLERGQATFVRNCSGCHGMDGRASGPSQLPKGSAPPRDLTDPNFHAERSDEQLASVIRNGKGLMPAFGVLLDPEQTAQVIAFIRTLPEQKK